MGDMLRDGAAVEGLVVKNLRALRCRGAPYLRTERRQPEQADPPGVIASASFEDWNLEYIDVAPASMPEIDLEQDTDLRAARFSRMTVNGKRLPDTTARAENGTRSREST